jgi:hypothetical protein
MNVVRTSATLSVWVTTFAELTRAPRRRTLHARGKASALVSRGAESAKWAGAGRSRVHARSNFPACTSASLEDRCRRCTSGSRVCAVCCAGFRATRSGSDSRLHVVEFCSKRLHLLLHVRELVRALLNRALELLNLVVLAYFRTPLRLPGHLTRPNLGRQQSSVKMSCMRHTARSTTNGQGCRCIAESAGRRRTGITCTG